MLVSLYVKNLVIIEEAAIELKEGLNILTGETGAGKSILIGSINIALGAKVSSDMIRKGKEYALVELVFVVDDERTLRTLRRMDIRLEDGDQLIISRKIMSGRSVNKVNGESVTISALKEIASTLLDLHGQHEHQSLLYKNVQLDIVDQYCMESANPIKEKILALYDEYKKVKKELSTFHMSEEDRLRELSFLEYEGKEIEEADLQEGEEERLTAEYKKYVNAGQIMEGLGGVHEITSTSQRSMSEQIGNAIKKMGPLVGYDGKMEGFLSQLTDMEDLLNGLNREISEYLEDFHYDEEAFRETERRLDLIHGLQNKYGGTLEKIMAYHQNVKEKIKRLNEYEEYKNRLEMKLSGIQDELSGQCKALSDIRKDSAKRLQERIKKALMDLNFLDVRFEIRFQELDGFTKSGVDEVAFVLATNPGEDLKPLSKVASGGELSRIMLAIKSVLADNDSIGTLVFDEIDVGISGRTAQKVSEKLAAIAKRRQVVCITHLAQIASMADAHYIIEKFVEQNKTLANIRLLNGDESIKELARISGGAKITDSVLKSASEMKELANLFKKSV